MGWIDALRRRRVRNKARRLEMAGDWQASLDTLLAWARKSADGRDVATYLAAIRRAGPKAGAKADIAPLRGAIEGDLDLTAKAASALLRTGRSREALSYWVGALDKGVGNAWPLLSYGQGSFDAGGYAIAEKIFMAAARKAQGEKDPRAARNAWRGAAAAAARLGYADMALSRQLHLWELGGRDARDAISLIQALAADDQVDRARQIADAFEGSRTEDTRVHEALARAIGDWAGLRALLKARLRHEPRDIDALVGLAQANARLGEPRMVLAAYRIARSYFGDALPPALVLLASQAARRLERHEDGMKILDTVDQRFDAPYSPGDQAKVRLVQAEMLLETGQLDALRALMPELQGDPDVPIDHRNRIAGHLAFRMEDWPSAATAFAAVNASHLRNPMTLRNELHAYARMGRTKALTLGLRHALDLYPDAPELLEMAARFAEEHADWESAANAWGRATDVAPGSREYAMRYALASLEAGRPHQAISQLERQDLETVTDAESALLHAYRAILWQDRPSLDEALERARAHGLAEPRLEQIRARAAQAERAASTAASV